MNLRIVKMYEPAIPVLSKLAKNSDGRWVDLCAGAGGGSIPLKEKMPGEIKELILTDLYPHKNIPSVSNVFYYPEPVDARNVPASLSGMRTLFTSFHHLPDDVAMNVLKNARDSQTSIGIFEFTERNLFCLLMVLPTFFFSFFLVPFIYPWKLSRFFWTYIIPAIPFVAAVDIVLSCFRTRNPAELLKMTEALRTPGYEWKVGKLPTYLGMTITYLTGRKSD